jgi:c-di-GMP-binding flagellar brake protein YcgR
MGKVKSEKNQVSLVALWERLELELIQGDQTTNFITRIEDIEDNLLIVEAPVRLSGSLQLAIGQKLRATVNKKDAAYDFEVIVANIDSDKESLTSLKPISSAERSQRRRFVRIDIAGDVSYRVLEIDQTGTSSLSLDKSGELLNISAGGILLTTRESVETNDVLLLKFWLKGSQRLENIIGIVKRVEQSHEADGPEEEYLVGIEFATRERMAQLVHAPHLESLPPEINYFNDALQQLIVQFVYLQQVETRKQMKANS